MDWFISEVSRNPELARSPHIPIVFMNPKGDHTTGGGHLQLHW